MINIDPVACETRDTYKLALGVDPAIFEPECCYGCGGQGYQVESRCCGQGEWECCGNPVPEQVQCEACWGAGWIDLNTYIKLVFL